MTARFLNAARAEFRSAVRYHEAQRPGLGAEVRAAVRRILSMPEAWHPLGDDLRRCRTDRFPYGVIDQTRDDEILIVAVAHLHQEPGRWRDRI